MVCSILYEVDLHKVQTLAPCLDSAILVAGRAALTVSV